MKEISKILKRGQQLKEIKTEFEGIKENVTLQATTLVTDIIAVNEKRNFQKALISNFCWVLLALSLVGVIIFKDIQHNKLLNNLEVTSTEYSVDTTGKGDAIINGEGIVNTNAESY